MSTMGLHVFPAHTRMLYTHVHIHVHSQTCKHQQTHSATLHTYPQNPTQTKPPPPTKTPPKPPNQSFVKKPMCYSSVLMVHESQCNFHGIGRMYKLHKLRFFHAPYWAAFSLHTITKEHNISDIWVTILALLLSKSNYKPFLCRDQT